MFFQIVLSIKPIFGALANALYKADGQAGVFAG